MKNLLFLFLLISSASFAQRIELNPNKPVPAIAKSPIKRLAIYTFSSLSRQESNWFFQKLKSKDSLSTDEDASFLALRAFRKSANKTVSIKLDATTVQNLVDEISSLNQDIARYVAAVERKKLIESYVSQLKKQEDVAGVTVEGSVLIPKQ